MAITRKHKEAIVEQVTDLLKTSKSVVFTNFSGLKVADVNALRGLCRKENVTYIVAKKTLLTIACDRAGIAVDPKTFSGEIATVFGIDDEVVAAKLLANFAKKHEAVKMVGGVLERKFLSQQEVVNLSKLPSKDELIAKVVGSIRAPLAGLVNVLQGNIRGLVQVLNQIKESKV